MRRIHKDRPLTPSEKRSRYLARDPKRRKRLAEYQRQYQQQYRARKRASLSAEELREARRAKSEDARRRRRAKYGAPLRLTATRLEIEDRRAALYEIVSQMQPMTVRQVFYQATVKGIVEKTETGYGKVQHELTKMRRDGSIPYYWLADNTRWQRKPRTFADPAEALRQTARFYRKSLWTNANCYVEVWLEKDALSGVIYDVTAEYDVPLMVARGYASLSFLYDAAEYIRTLEVPTYIYHFGDFDPSGVDAAKKIEQTLKEMCPDSVIIFERAAVTKQQIKDYDLPTRPTKTTDTRAKHFKGRSVELDAMDPDTLRGLVRERLEEHLPAHEFEVLKAAEESERAIMSKLVGRLEKRL